MAVSMASPVCLVDNGPDGHMRVQQEALQILEQIQQPVVVVAVVGLYRTGKSYLMNRLAGKHTGFALGSTIESKTKGIWMWCVPHPSKPEYTLVLLDTEGLGDVDKGDSKHDTQIFSLAVLLSSTLVYNSRGTIDNKAVEELQYVTELAEHIKVKACDEPKDDSEFVKFFPNFIWAVRDFTLERKIEGKDATEDEYLDFALKLKPGNSKRVNEYNLPRECIRKYFPSRKCFTFPFPTHPEDVIRLESLSETELAPKFLDITERFCSFVFDQSLVKQLKDGHTVDGRLFGNLVKIYVEIMSSGGMPCLENAVVAMAQIENEAAVKEALEVYESAMLQLALYFPVDLKDITAQHQSLNSLATQVFIKRSFKDEEGTHMKSLEESINKLFQGFVQQNEEASVQICQELLSGLSAPLREKLQQGFYTTIGGYKHYCQDIEDIIVKYNSQTHRGVKGEDVLEEFLKQRKEESSAVLQADQSLSAMDKQMCEERELNVLLEQELKANEERQIQLELSMQAERESNEERVRLALQQMEEEMEAQREEARRATESQLREQAALLQRGFQEQADRMQLEIQRSQSRAREAEEARGQEFNRLMEQQERRHSQAMEEMRRQQEAIRNQRPQVVYQRRSGCTIQ